MTFARIFGVVALAATALACSTSSSDPETETRTEPRALGVETAYGPVEGFEEDGVFSYRGIPYAAPPVGELRWKPPIEPVPWNATLSATDTPPVCPQTAFAGLPVPGFNPNEDCLYLNVDTPAEGERLPVMVWIHGGGFTIGEGLQADGGTSGDRIARESGVIVVSMNYRLGQLGFLAHSALTAESPQGASGNYGLMDQAAALRWVRNNIEAFGGDPGNVTVFGESAGGFSVCAHLGSGFSAGLFDKAIVMSGSCQRPWATREQAEVQGDAFAEALGCGESGDVLECMRDKSFDEVLEALPAGDNFGFNPTDEPQGSWFPIVDGLFITEQTADSFASGNFNRVPTIIGFTRDEARLFTWLASLSVPPLVVNSENYEELIAYYLGGDTELAARAAARYDFDTYSPPEVALAALTTDSQFRCPARDEAATLSEFVPTYLYQFEFTGGRSQLEVALPFIGAGLPEYELGAFHSSEIGYVFGYDPLLELDVTTFSSTLLEWEPESSDEALWLDMLGYFTRFAATGDPTSQDSAAWPQYDPEEMGYLAIDSTTVVSTDPAPGCDFWDGEAYLSARIFGE